MADASEHTDAAAAAAAAYAAARWPAMTFPQPCALCGTPLYDLRWWCGRCVAARAPSTEVP